MLLHLVSEQIRKPGDEILIASQKIQKGTDKVRSPLLCLGISWSCKKRSQALAKFAGCSNIDFQVNSSPSIDLQMSGVPLGFHS
jgi:hypothetical protein